MRIGFAALLTLLVPELCLAQSTAPSTQPLPVHMLVPGFTVRELPIKVTNLDNVAYGPDGKLYAVGYDGRVHVLTDTDGDGLEDHVEPWCYDHAADLRAPVGVLIRPEGMYIASKGRVSLLRDTTGAGKADHYEVVVGGWQEIKNNVDALGVAIDKAGNLYYGRGAEDYRNPLLVDKQGVPHYDLKAESGTVMRVSPDRKTREVIATGIRFTVGMAFNREGDLFATDQEGATWVPNGNPLDKLEQIIPGRHYGFPPKSLNPEYLKSVVDEPAVVSFGPQHQSSCGLRFNERTDTQASFGPDAWEGDALVVGESRGKLWRCPLVKTAAGYVGKPILIGTLDMLAIDLAISPKGDLVICCHSGKPDWGTGPKGIGRVFKISYTGRDEPQPVIAWPASREEIRVAFDKPLDPFVLTTSKTVIGGRYVRAADRLEIMKPPYAAVKQQEATPRKTIRVLAQEIAAGGRTLVLKTEPLPWRANYSVAIPGVKAVGEAGAGSTVDVDVTLNGVMATAETNGATTSRWVPHLDPAVGSRWTRGAKPPTTDGAETLHTYLDVPGTKVYLTLRSVRPLQAKLGDVTARSGGGSMNHGWGCSIESSVNGPLALEIQPGPTPPGNLILAASYHTDVDPFERPIPAERLWLPWAKDLPPAPDAPVDHKPLGDWARGKALFYGEAQCYTCHTVRGEGGAVGPDLSNLTFKDPDATLNDILHPSATINPDYVSYVVKSKTGETLTGLVAAEGTDQFRVTEGPGKSTVIRREQVQSMTPSATSLMPEIFQALGSDKLNDVLEFLTGEQPRAAK